jgi:hypothetical protein
MGRTVDRFERERKKERREKFTQPLLVTALVVVLGIVGILFDRLGTITREWPLTSVLFGLGASLGAFLFVSFRRRTDADVANWQVFVGLGSLAIFISILLVAGSMALGL